MDSVADNELTLHEREPLPILLIPYKPSSLHRDSQSQEKYVTFPIIILATSRGHFKIWFLSYFSCICFALILKYLLIYFFPFSFQLSSNLKSNNFDFELLSTFEAWEKISTELLTTQTHIGKCCSGGYRGCNIVPAWLESLF